MDAVIHHVCYSCCHPAQPSSANPSRTDTCEMCGHRGEGQRRETVRNEYGQLVVTQNMNPAWSESRKALGEIEDAWLKRTGSSELPGGGGLLREWHAFRDGWQLARKQEWLGNRLADYIQSYYSMNPPMPSGIETALRDYQDARRDKNYDNA